MSAQPHTHCPGCGNPYPPAARSCPLCARPRENAVNAPSTPSAQQAPAFAPKPANSASFAAPVAEPTPTPNANPLRLLMHRIFVVLSVLWAGYLPIRILMIMAHDASIPKSQAARIGSNLGMMVGIGLWFPLWLMVLTPLVLVAIFAKPGKK